MCTYFARKVRASASIQGTKRPRGRSGVRERAGDGADRGPGPGECQGVSIPPVGTYELDAVHTVVGFVARHMLSKVRGEAGGFFKDLAEAMQKDLGVALAKESKSV